MFGKCLPLSTPIEDLLPPGELYPHSDFWPGILPCQTAFVSKDYFIPVGTTLTSNAVQANIDHTVDMPGRGLEPQEDQDCCITLSTASGLRTRTRSSRRRRLTDDREEAPRKPMTPSGQQLMALEYRLFCAEAPRFFPQPVLSRPCSPGGRMLGAERLSAELAEAMREEMLAKAPARNPPPATHKGAIDTSKRRPGSPADDPRGRKLHRSIRFPDKAALPRKRLPGETKTDGEDDGRPADVAIDEIPMCAAVDYCR